MNDDSQVDATLARLNAEVEAEPQVAPVKEYVKYLYKNRSEGSLAQQEYENSPEALYGDTKPTYGLEHEQPSHRIILYLKTLGLSNKEIAAKTGNSEPWISQVTRQPWFRLRLVHELKQAGRESLTALFETEGTNSFWRLVAERDNEDARASDRINAANSILDRLLGKPVQKQEVRNETVSTPETVAALDRELAQLQSEIKRTTGTTN